MALVDPSIAMSYRGVELPNQLAQYAQVQQIQNAQNQNRLADAQMAEYQRAQAEEEGLRNYLASADLANPETRSGLTRFGKSGLAYGKALTERDTAELTQQKTRLEVQEKKKAFMSQALRDISGNPSDANITAYLEDLAANPLFSDDEKASVTSTASRLLGMPVDQRGAFMASQGAAAAAAPTTPADVATMQRLGFPLTPEGYEAFRAAQRQERMLSPEEEAQRMRISAAGRAPAAPPTPSAPVAVVDPVTNKPVLVSREDAIGKTPATAIEGLTPKERQQREAKYPQATSAVKTFAATSDTLIKDLETLSKHPGLNSITGIAAGRLPGITSAGREAEALFDKIVARGGFQELQNMRQASPTGGALGNVSNREGAQLQQAFAALDRRQDAPSVRKAITDAINQIRTAQQTVKDAYDLTYEYKQGTAPAAKPSLDSIFGPK